MKKKQYITPTTKFVVIEEELLNGWSTDDGHFGKDTEEEEGDPWVDAT